jgi:hypothetical protein
LHIDTFYFSESNKNKKQYLLNIDIFGHGSVIVNGQNEYQQQLLFNEGSTISLQALPAMFYQFVSWNGDFQSGLEEMEISMDSNIYLTAFFKANPEAPFFIYPNPFIDQVHFNKEDAIRELVIFNSTSQPIFSYKYPATTVSLACLTPGVYYFLIEDTYGKKHYHKMIKVVK